MFSFSLETIISPFRFTKLPSFVFIGAPFAVPIPKTKIAMFFSLANAASFEKSLLSPPSLIIKRYFFDSFFTLLSSVSSIDIRFVPFSVIDVVSSWRSKKPTALWSKLSGETR